MTKTKVKEKDLHNKGPKHAGAITNHLKLHSKHLEGKRNPKTPNRCNSREITIWQSQNARGVCI